MEVKELINILKQYPQDLSVRVINTDFDDDVNLWVNDTECHATGSSGYELSGEVILKISE